MHESGRGHIFEIALEVDKQAGIVVRRRVFDFASNCDPWSAGDNGTQARVRRKGKVGLSPEPCAQSVGVQRLQKAKSHDKAR